MKYLNSKRLARLPNTRSSISGWKGTKFSTKKIEKSTSQSKFFQFENFCPSKIQKSNVLSNLTRHLLLRGNEKKIKQSRDMNVREYCTIFEVPNNFFQEKLQSFTADLTIVFSVILFSLFLSAQGE